MADQAVLIQRWYRRHISRRKLLRSQVDQFLSDYNSETSFGVDLFKAGLKLESFYNKSNDLTRFRLFCGTILTSMESSRVKSWYVSVALDKTHSVQWIKQVKWCLLTAVKNLKGLKPGMPKDDQFVQTFLSTFVLLTDSTLWKLSAKGGDALRPTLHKLCSSFTNHLIENDLFVYLHDLLLNGVSHPRVRLDRHALPAAMGLRVLAMTNFSVECLGMFMSNVLTVPAVIYHLNQYSHEALVNLMKHNITDRLFGVMNDQVGVVLKDKDKTEILSLLGNLMQLKQLEGEIDKEIGPETVTTLQYIEVLIKFLSLLGQDSSKAKLTVTTTWHLFFGWIDHSSDKRLLDCLSHLWVQLQILWHPYWVKNLFNSILTINWDETGKPPSSLLKKKLFSSSSSSIIKMTSQEQTTIFTAAHFYTCVLRELPQLANDTLIGLSANGRLVSSLWYFLSHVIAIDVKRVQCDMRETSRDLTVVPVLVLMCQTGKYLLSVLDDQELYEEQKYFSLEELQKLILFLNNFVYSCIWEETDKEREGRERKGVIQSCLSCLVLLLQRNQRKSFLPQEDSLLIKNLKVSRFLSELKTSTPRALRVLRELPHIIPHNKRVEIFYDYIKVDKSLLGIGSGHSHTPATYITVHRGRLLDDGYQQLCGVSTGLMKGIIRVKFVNEQGLDEAGIDEMGVFKEFLEEIIKQAFDPELGLFKVNSDGALFPSHTSECHDNHLGLLEFLGRMLGKAVYEGIVLDLPFAVFFLHHLTKQPHSIFYSSLDELHSLDPELSKSLHFIKHYDGDMTDLCLTFSYEENFLGKMVTHELIPGGSGVAVTAENKINYVHKLAHYKMSTQIKDQTNAFVKGFHSIIDPQWMSMFSAREFQRVISGDDTDINIDELRRHTQYFGGYHDKHRVILWLWDILRNDFTTAERSSFLKFVTSCSRQPLLGFSSLDPPFSIRRVDCPGEEEAIHVTGVIKTLLGVRTHKDRLPTSSTCFNLLKLPDYNKKSILREKLVFAITSNAGFELS